MKKEYTLDIQLKEALWTDVFSESYKIVLRDEFVNKDHPKELSFRNHVYGFLSQLKNNNSPLTKKVLAKRDVYVVSYGLNNTGSEVNGDRPSIIYKSSDGIKWEDITVIPLTSALQNKLTDSYDILVKKEKDNQLYQDSRARLRQLKAISIKKIGRPLGKITDKKLQNEIDTSVKKMLGLV